MIKRFLILLFLTSSVFVFGDEIIEVGGNTPYYCIGEYRSGEELKTIDSNIVKIRIIEQQELLSDTFHFTKFIPEEKDFVFVRFAPEFQELLSEAELLPEPDFHFYRFTPANKEFRFYRLTPEIYEAIKTTRETEILPLPADSIYSFYRFVPESTGYSFHRLTRKIEKQQEIIHEDLVEENPDPSFMFSKYIPVDEMFVFLRYLPAVEEDIPEIFEQAEPVFQFVKYIPQNSSFQYSRFTPELAKDEFIPHESEFEFFRLISREEGFNYYRLTPELESEFKEDISRYVFYRFTPLKDEFIFSRLTPEQDVSYVEKIPELFLHISPASFIKSDQQKFDILLRFSNQTSSELREVNVRLKIPGLVTLNSLPPNAVIDDEKGLLIWNIPYSLSPGDVETLKFSAEYRE